MSAVRILEELPVFTPLGIRFWDPVQNDQIRAGLHVTAWPARPSGRPPEVAVAFRTASDVYAFHALPGLRALQYGLPDPITLASPPPTRRFVVHVEDTLGRFLSAAFAVALPLPHRGVFPRDALASPPEPGSRGFLLYSAATRSNASWLAGVTGELVTPSGTAAGHSLVRVHLPDGGSVSGLANGDGIFAVPFPYPPLPHLLGDGSPPASPPATRRQAALQAGEWEIALEVRYEPGRLEPLPGTSLPDYLSVISQAPADVLPVRPEDGGLPQPIWVGTLRYGQTVIARTDGMTQLLVAPVSTSP